MDDSQVLHGLQAIDEVMIKPGEDKWFEEDVYYQCAFTNRN